MAQAISYVDPQLLTYMALEERLAQAMEVKPILRFLLECGFTERPYVQIVFESISNTYLCLIVFARYN